MRKFSLLLAICLLVVFCLAGCSGGGGGGDTRIHIGRPGEARDMAGLRLARGLRREVFYVGGPAFPGSYTGLVVLVGDENLLPEYTVNWSVSDEAVLRLDLVWGGDSLTRSASMLPQGLGTVTVQAWQADDPANIDSAQVVVLPSAVLYVGGNYKFNVAGALVGATAADADISVLSDTQIRFGRGALDLGGGTTDDLGDLTAEAAGTPGHDAVTFAKADFMTEMYVFWDANGRLMAGLGGREGMVFRELAAAP
jgi:hypothetical protein